MIREMPATPAQHEPNTGPETPRTPAQHEPNEASEASDTQEFPAISALLSALASTLMLLVMVLSSLGAAAPSKWPQRASFVTGGVIVCDRGGQELLASGIPRQTGKASKNRLPIAFDGGAGLKGEWAHRAKTGILRVMDVKPAEFVRWVDPDDSKSELVNDAKALTWEFEAEHLLLRLTTGALAIVRGGLDGIQFAVQGEGDSRTLHLEIEGNPAQVAEIIWHTHPRVTGPSDGDFESLAILKQAESTIFEIGGDRHGTRFTPKAGRPPRRDHRSGDY